MFVNREQMALLVADEWNHSEPEEVRRELDSAFVMLGLLPVRFDTRRAVSNEFAHRPRGLYLVSKRVVTLPHEIAERDVPGALLHEIVHAYQDAYHQLGDRVRYQPGSSDRTSAIHAMAEGEALHLELETQLSPQFGHSPLNENEIEAFLRTSVPPDLPELIQRSLVAPYLDGYRFIAYLRRVGGWSLVEKIWERGVAGSSEVLHPERWVPNCLSGPCTIESRASLPRPVPAPDAIQSLRCEDSLGEEGLRLVVEATIDTAAAAALVADYVDDRFSVFRSHDARSLAWQIRLGSERHAASLCAALASVFTLGRPTSSQQWCAVKDRAAIALSCRGRDIRVVSRGLADTWTAHTRPTSCEQMGRWLWEFRTLHQVSL